MKLAPKTYVKTVEYDESGEAYIEIPEICEELGWKEGDTLEWTANDDGSYTISRKEEVPTETELVLVETIQTFRHRYVVEVPRGKKAWALDTVTMEEAKELSQEHLGETIVSHRVLSRQEFLDLFDSDNDYLRSWEEDAKMNYVTQITPKGEVQNGI